MARLHDEQGEQPAGASPHGGPGTSRYDVWRIALGQFRDHPLTGVGADNYLVGYLQQRRTHEVARYPESIELRVLSETGIVGALLFFGFLAVALLPLWRQARRHIAPTAALACLAGCGYLLLHSSVDWFWEFPALTGVALALLAVGGAEPLPQRAGRGASRATLAAAGVAAVVVVGALAVPWAAVSLTDEAFANGPSRHSYALLNTAARLNPYSEQPRLTEAGLAAAAGPAGRARERRALHEALRRNPFDWFAYFELGILSGSENRPRRRAGRARACTSALAAGSRGRLRATAACDREAAHSAADGRDPARGHLDAARSAAALSRVSGLSSREDPASWESSQNRVRGVVREADTCLFCSGHRGARRMLGGVRELIDLRP